MKMYHVFYDLEVQFPSLKECKEYFSHLEWLKPAIPHSAGKDEDKTIPRVSVAPTILDCFAGIVCDVRFRRCVSGNEYGNKNEVYPIVVVTVEGNFIQPTPDLVPDVNETNEYWSLKHCRVVHWELQWLGNESIILEHDDETGSDFCVECSPVSPLCMDHPWLNGKGHPLECSDSASIQWPSPERFYRHIFIETFMRGKLVFAMPEVPSSGYAICTPLDGSEQYRARLHNCKVFSGFVDRNGTPIFDESLCSVPGSGLCSAGMSASGTWNFLGEPFSSFVVGKNQLNVEVLYKEITADEWANIMAKVGVPVQTLQGQAIKGMNLFK